MSYQSPLPSSLEEPNIIGHIRKIIKEHFKFDREGYLLVTDTPGESGTIPYDGNATTTVNQSTLLTLRRVAHHILVQNNTTVNVNIAFDKGVSPGSLLLVPGAIYKDDRFVQNISVLAGSVINIGGEVSGNLYIEAWD